jgi:hypothetical protein
LTKNISNPNDEHSFSLKWLPSQNEFEISIDNSKLEQNTSISDVFNLSPNATLLLSQGLLNASSSASNLKEEKDQPPIPIEKEKPRVKSELQLREEEAYGRGRFEQTETLKTLLKKMDYTERYLDSDRKKVNEDYIILRLKVEREVKKIKEADEQRRREEKRIEEELIAEDEAAY